MNDEVEEMAAQLESDDSPRCFYCGMPVQKASMQLDHFPQPKRHGGTMVVAACINCHDLKDRISLRNWGAREAFDAMRNLWDKASAMERLLLAKMLDTVADYVPGERS